MLSRTACCSLLFAPALALAAPAGFVLSLEGEWSIRGGAALAVGAEVPPGAEIAVKDPHPFAAIRIVDARSGAILLSVQCNEPARCARPIAVPAGSAPPNSVAAALLEKVISKLRSAPDRYVSTISRSHAGAGESAVLEHDDRHLLIGPALRGLPAGQYLARLARLDCPPGGADCAPILLPQFAWMPGQATRVEFRGVPGLYELVVSLAEGSLASVARPWVRIERRPRHEEMARAFEAARVLASSWGDSVDEATRAAFLRGALESIGSPAA